MDHRDAPGPQTATRPDILFSVCLCARFQASSRTSHQQAIKMIFQVSLIHSCAWSLVLGALFPFVSWFFRCRLCGVSSQSEINFGDLPVFGIFACFLVFSKTV
jgi:hypothetical protein